MCNFNVFTDIAMKTTRTKTSRRTQRLVKHNIMTINLILCENIPGAQLNVPAVKKFKI